MFRFFMDRRFFQKLMVLFLVVGLVPMAIIGQQSVSQATLAMEDKLGETLTGLRDAKAKSVRDYFENRRREIQLLATTPLVISNAQQLRAAFPRVASDNQMDAAQLERYKGALLTYYKDEFGVEYEKRNRSQADTDAPFNKLSTEAMVLQYLYIRANQNPLGSKHLLDAASDNSAYSQTHVDLHGFLRNALTAFGYYDIFLVDPETGDVFYTVFKELDFATNLNAGPWAESGLAEAFRKANALESGKSVMVDFARYRPSYDDPASFMAAPIFQDGKKVAIVILQLPLEPMNAIMNDRSGLGQTGETYLVGQDQLMRSDSVLSEAHRVKASFAFPEKGRVSNTSAVVAFEKPASVISDLNFENEPTLTAYDTLNFGDFKWAIVASQTAAEVLAPVAAMERNAVLIGGISVLVIVFAAWWFGRVMARPITGLRNLIVDVEKTGEFQHSALLVYSDEIGQTVKAFENLMRVLKSAFSDANAVLAKVVEGEYIATQADHYRGDIHRLASNIDTTVEQLRAGQARQRIQQQEIESVAEAMKQKALENEMLARQASADADSANRVKQALDVSATPAMMADEANIIVYANQAANRLVMQLESAFQTVLPHFRASGLLGTQLDELYRGAAQTNATHTSGSGSTEVVIAGNTLRLTCSPIMKEGARVGVVAEWIDRTAEVGIERSIATLLEAASHGDFTQQVDERGKEGFYLELSKGLNQLVNTTQVALDDFSLVMASMAKGELSARIEKPYQGTFGQLRNDVNATLVKLTEVVEEIIESSSAISTGAAEIHEGVSNLGRRTEQQAASVEETASSMEEMTASVKTSAQNAATVLDLSKQAEDFAKAGHEVVSRAVTSMEGISKASKEIADIIGVIDAIAFQTNILALNAAVEAARAGEQGRGFAVVAAEVRMLAQRSAQAAKEIKGLISDSVARVNTGNTLVTESGHRLQDIIIAVDKVAKEVRAIASASKEQATGISQVNAAINSLDQSTQQNSALVEQATAAAESMATNARGMVQMASFFSLR